MPLYELFCMARPALSRVDCGSIMRSAATAVLQKGGVLTDIKSFGERELAYQIRRPGLKMIEAFLWQLDFAASPAVLKDLDHLLKVDDRVVRFVILKRSPFEPLPTTHWIAQKARQLLQEDASAAA